MSAPASEPPAPEPSFARRVIPKLGMSLALAGLFVWLLERGGMPLIPSGEAMANVRWWTVPAYLVLLLATWGMTVIGTMFSAMTVNLRLRELMLPTLVYPMIIPLLMSAMQLTTVLLAGQSIAGDNLIWLRLLVGFDIIFTALALGLVETVLVG